MQLTDNQWELLKRRATKQISAEVLEQNFLNKADLHSLYSLLNAIIDEITHLLPEETSEAQRRFADVFWYLPKNISSQEETMLYRKYLLNPWHREHEEMITAFQTDLNDDKDNIPYLVQALINPPDYIMSVTERKASYVRKGAYAIAAQPEPYNIEALTELGQSKDEVIRLYAEHQLNKIADRKRRL